MARKRIPEGMRLRGDSYYADFRHNGRRYRQKLSTNLEAAKDVYKRQIYTPSAVAS